MNAINRYIAEHGGESGWELDAIVEETIGRGPFKTVVEIGTHKGASLRIWREAFPEALIIGIEPTGMLTDDFCSEQHIRKIPGLSQSPHVLAEVEHVLKTWSREIDFLFIDGDHTLDALWQDWTFYTPLVRDGGIVVLHDAVITWNPTVHVHRFYPKVQSLGWPSKIVFSGKGDPSDPHCPSTGAAIFQVCREHPNTPRLPMTATSTT